MRKVGIFFTCFVLLMLLSSLLSGFLGYQARESWNNAAVTSSCNITNTLIFERNCPYDCDCHYVCDYGDYCHTRCSTCYRTCYEGGAIFEHKFNGTIYNKYIILYEEIRDHNSVNFLLNRDYIVNQNQIMLFSPR